MRSFAVVVIGAGVTGLSVAHHLASLGLRDVAVLEKDSVASGATGRSAGGIRLQFSDPTNINLAKHSVEIFENFGDRFGMECDFRQHGYLMLATTADEATQFEQNVRLQQSLGVPAEILSAEAVADIVPGIRTEDVVCASFCPRDGYADPYSVATAYAATARRLGVKVFEGARVVSIEVDRGKVVAVNTAADSFCTELVVNAAGPWAGEVAKLAGIALPIEPYRRQVFVTGPFEDAPERLPMVIDFRTHFYFRREGHGLLLGMTDLTEPPSFNTNVDWAFLERIMEIGLWRFPPLGRASILRGWAGLYDTTPDNNPILGPIPQLDGFIVAAGFSGHGFMLSPAIGQCLAELIVEGSSRTVDLTPFQVERFMDGRKREERNII